MNLPCLWGRGEGDSLTFQRKSIRVALTGLAMVGAELR